jgi:dihydrofolate reductase
VITNDPGWKHEGVTVVHSLREALNEAGNFGVKEIFVVGGASIFSSTFDAADRIYLTRIHHRFQGDVYFPEVSPHRWNLMQSRFCAADEKNVYAHTFQVWEKR